MIDFVLSMLGFEGPGALLALIVGTLAAVGAAWLRGRQSAKSEEETYDLRDYQETRKRIDDVVDHAGSDDERREWLRDRSTK